MVLFWLHSAIGSNSYDIKVVSSKKTGKVEGYIYKFRCLPILYTALKAWCKTGNGLAELEIRTVK